MINVRRIAAHEVLIADKTYSPGVVEIVEGKVVSCYKLIGEQAQTEWFGGTIIVKKNAEGYSKAYYKGKPIN